MPTGSRTGINDAPARRPVRSHSLPAIGGAASPASAPLAAAAPCVVIYRVYFDSPGSDTGSNTSLNAEWIKLRNRCSTSKSLSGWRIKDKAGHTYPFGTYTLAGGAYVKVHTGRHQLGGQPVLGAALVHLEQHR